jgi:lysophospholipase L1-like esterase
MKVFRTLSIIACLTVVSIQHSFACPVIGRLPDFNCNGRLDVVVLGDSLVAGVGDKQVKGGYVSRAETEITEAQFYNFGVPSETALRLVRKLLMAFRGSAKTALAKDLLAADIVFIDTGRNDHWHQESPRTTFRNLKRARSIIEERVRALTGHKPLVVQAVLMHPNRRIQTPWVIKLDDLLLSSNTISSPANLRFDRVSKTLLSADNIHPTSAGYAQMSNMFVSYLLEYLPRYAKKLRPDRNEDGLYDEFEYRRADLP